VLAAIGYGDQVRLEQLVRAWDSLFELVAPDLIIADYAPTAVLAARGRYEVVVIGDAFTLPPLGDTFPYFANGNAAPRIEEQPLLACVNKVQVRRGAASIDRLPDINAAASRFIVTLPELTVDYAQDPGVKIVGPLESLPPRARRTSTKDYFAYLSLHAPGVSKALRALASSGLSGELYIRDCSSEQLAGLNRLGLVVHTSPRELGSAISEAKLLIHHGGLGTSQAGLAVGRPQLLIPRHQEQALNTRMLMRLGVAVGMRTGGKYQADHVQAALHHVTQADKFERAAKRLAKDIEGRSAGAALDKILNACVGVLGR
jgi:hypothetical protein